MREDVSDNSVVLRYGDGEYTYPVIDSTVGDKGFDIGKLRAQTGLVTLDSGYGNTAAYKSAITYLDGEQGILGNVISVGSAGRGVVDQGDIESDAVRRWIHVRAAIGGVAIQI